MFARPNARARELSRLEPFADCSYMTTLAQRLREVQAA